MSKATDSSHSDSNGEMKYKTPSSKSKSIFKARQTTGRVVNEADLIVKKDPITPEDVLGLQAATSGKCL